MGEQSNGTSSASEQNVHTMRGRLSGCGLGRSEYGLCVVSRRHSGSQLSAFPILCVNEHLEFAVRFAFYGEFFGLHPNILNVCRIDRVLNPHWSL